MGASSVTTGVVVALAVLALGLVVYSGPVADFVKEQANARTGSFWTLATVLRILHVTAFATIFGMQLWVSFIGGVIMFKHLPRHQFGNLQSRMFPVYFQLAAVALALNISVLAILNPLAAATLWETLQFVALGLALVFTLTNLLVMEPVTTKLMRERHKAEKEDGISTEPGVNRKKEIEKAGPKLRAINKKFGALHGISSLLNLFAFWGLLVHVAYLGSRLAL
ncbi:unnamed protein product [Calypogeia fissa]